MANDYLVYKDIFFCVIPFNQKKTMKEMQYKFNR